MSQFLGRLRNLPNGTTILDVGFLVSVSISFAFLWAARTGESINNPWQVVNPFFFASYFSASTFLALIVITRPKGTFKFLAYSTVLFLIPASVYLAVLVHSYATPGIATHLGWEQRIAEFGGYFSNPTAPEHPAGFIHKNFAQTGWHLLVVFLSKASQLDVTVVSLVTVPVAFSVFIPFLSIQLIRAIKPRDRSLGPIVVFSFLLSQYIIFTLLPPGKPETLALIFMFATISIFAVAPPPDSPRSRRWFLAILAIGLSTVLFHPAVGLVAILILLSMIVANRYLPFQDRRYVLFQGGIILGIIALFFSLFGLAIAEGYLGPNFRFALPDSFSLGTLMIALYLEPWFVLDSATSHSAVLLFLNNFQYLLYFLFVIGTVHWMRRKFDPRILSLFLVLGVTLPAMMIIQGTFYPDVAWERIRFLYYLSFLAVPVIGAGTYALIRAVLPPQLSRTSSVAHHSSKTRIPERRVALRVIVVTLFIASLSTAAIYGGYPRIHSFGPYWGLEPSYPSDYDVEAVQLIDRMEDENEYGFFIIGDLFTAAAAVAELGYRTIWDGNVSTPIYSFLASRIWPFDSMWTLVISEAPEKSVPLILEATASLVDHTYLILTSRLGEERLEGLSQSYAAFLGPPILGHSGKLHVFLLDSS